MSFLKLFSDFIRGNFKQTDKVHFSLKRAAVVMIYFMIYIQKYFSTLEDLYSKQTFQ